MSAKVTDSRPSWEVFVQCVRTISTVFVISDLTDHQRQALYCLISGGGVFVNLPTGYGKSLIFHMAPLVHTVEPLISGHPWDRLEVSAYEGCPLTGG